VCPRSSTSTPLLALRASLQSLILPLSSLASALPPDLADLTSLEELDLSANMLGGELRAGLGRLSRLTKLDVSNNYDLQLSSDVGALTALRFLSLSNSREDLTSQPTASALSLSSPSWTSPSAPSEGPSRTLSLLCRACSI